MFASRPVHHSLFKEDSIHLVVNRWPKTHSKIGHDEAAISGFLKPFNIARVTIGRQALGMDHYVAALEFDNHEHAEAAKKLLQNEGITAVYPRNVKMQMSNIPVQVTSEMMTEWLDHPPHVLLKAPGISKLSPDEKKKCTQVWLHFSSAEAAVKAFMDVVDGPAPSWNMHLPAWFVVNFETYPIDITDVPLLSPPQNLGLSHHTAATHTWASAAPMQDVQTAQRAQPDYSSEPAQPAQLAQPLYTAQQPAQPVYINQPAAQPVFTTQQTAQLGQVAQQASQVSKAEARPMGVTPTTAGNPSTSPEDETQMHWSLKFPKRAAEDVTLHWIPADIEVRPNHPRVVAEALPMTRNRRKDASDLVREFNGLYPPDDAVRKIEFLASQDTMDQIAHDARRRFLYGVAPTPALTHDLMDKFGQGKNSIAVLRPNDSATCFLFSSRAANVELDEAVVDEYTLFALFALQ